MMRAQPVGLRPSENQWPTEKSFRPERSRPRPRGDSRRVASSSCQNRVQPPQDQAERGQEQAERGQEQAERGHPKSNLRIAIALF